MMEIDFLGVGRISGSPDVQVEEVVGEGEEEEDDDDDDGTKDSATPESARMSEMQWSFSDKVSKPSQMLSFQTSPEEKAGKTVQDFDLKLLDNSLQKNALDVPTQCYYTVSGLPLPQFQAQPVGFNREMKRFPCLSHLGHTLINAPVIQSCPPVLNSQHFPVGHPSIFPSSHPQMGAAICRDTNAPKSSGAPAQLTIFFAGSVYVYEEVSPEKAQAIMSLARSCSSTSPSKTVSTTLVRSQHVRPSFEEACDGNKFSTLSFSLARTNQVNTQQVIMTPAALIPAVAIPQARKVSLARFLERRKERIIKSSPYGFNKSSPEQSSAPSDNLSCSAANSPGSIFNSEVGHK